MDAAALRDRLLRALVEPARGPAATLVGADAEVAWLDTPSGPSLVLLRAPDDLAALEARARRVVDALQRGTLHLVVCGGGPDVAPALCRLAPGFSLRRRVAIHQLDGEGRLVRVAGRLRLAELDAAVARLAEVTPLSPEEIAARLREGAPLVAAERRFASAVSAPFPAVTVALGVACVAMFLLEELWGGSPLVHLRMGANQGERAFGGEPWRLLSYAFLHGGVAHLAFNLLALASFGPFLEALLGRRRYLVLYTLAALGGALGSAIGHPKTYSVGASGALFGLMGAGIGLALRPRGLLPPATLGRLKKQMWSPLVINLVYSLQAGIDLLAHVGGVLAGLALVGGGLLALGLEPADADGGSRARGFGVLAWLCGLAMALSVGAALVTGRPWELRSPPPLTAQSVPGGALLLDVPRGFAPGEVEHHENATLASWGTPRRDPLLIETVVLPLQAAPPDPEVALDELRGEVDRAQAKGIQPSGKARVETVGARRMVVRDERTEGGLDRTSYAAIVGRATVVVRVYRLADGLAAWNGVGARVAGSLREGPGDPASAAGSGIRPVAP